MSEEETKESTSDNAGEGNKPEESKAVAKLRKDNERLEKQLAKKKDLLEEQKVLEARETLGGTTGGGQEREKPKVETPKEYVERNFANLR